MSFITAKRNGISLNLLPPRLLYINGQPLSAKHCAWQPDPDPVSPTIASTALAEVIAQVGANDCWLTADMTSVYCSMRPPYGAPPSTGLLDELSKGWGMGWGETGKRKDKSQFNMYRPRCVKFGLNQTGILDPGLSQCKVPCLVGEARGINPISGSRETKQAVTAGNAKNMLQLEGLRAASRPDRNNRLVSVLDVCCRVDRNCRALWSVPSVLDQCSRASLSLPLGYSIFGIDTYPSLLNCYRLGDRYNMYL
ncbi:hypothetical protein PCH_Pc22g09000 [Penicillium rubens Wisconsin 54-1255]|uniref:Uncharacterized protein n=1 Tax=Penicillium rubens (strain ATCC 28089 / DSM 1075 / NRRL 1951 / Wisconsin 54-1255) TaxID=500485 RepID=B6HTI7_PENRW|nr:hypothetical protein PCH_Pc22g09000 [Penicillium rubens Wisconsin 54-1255]